MGAMWSLLAIVIVTTAAAGQSPPELPVVVVDRDDVRISQSCRVLIDRPFIVDANSDGVVHVVGEEITVDFGNGRLHGAAPGTTPDGFTGVGVRIVAGGGTVRNLSVSGFKVGIHATGADGALLEDLDVSGNFRQRLRSTVAAEAGVDWLRPHENDRNEWIDRYGAGLVVEDTSRVTVRRVHARQVQNGIILDNVDGSRIYDSDCSFLSGWGLAMWRSSGNLVCRNAFDFCVRGYSHGVYNRGQDSAGILMFEQCSDNIIVENSATHGGDGFFGFAGREALGEVDPREDRGWYERRGNNRNVLFGNDFSFAAAHGIELTFSFDNQLTANRLVGNAICGVWGGYSQDTTILGNMFEANGEMGYGLERGGVNIEHGRGNRIQYNRFVRNACGVHLWWDPDEGLMSLPWAKTNERGSTDNVIEFNRFTGDTVGVQLRRTTGTRLLAAVMEGVGTPIEADEESDVAQDDWDGPVPEIALQPPKRVGTTRPVGARKHLRGRENIVMTEWGPYDWRTPLLHMLEATSSRHVYRLLGPEKMQSAVLRESPGVTLTHDGDGRLTVAADAVGVAADYRLVATTGASTLEVTGLLVPTTWDVRVFTWTIDPREDVEAWRAEAEQRALLARSESLHLVYGTGGPSDMDLGDAVRSTKLPADRFGTIATTQVRLPAGRYVIRTRSDDGIRVWLGGTPVIDDWTWHPPKEHRHEFDVAEADRAIELRVEHFELEGYAVLSLDLERLFRNPEPSTPNP